MEFKRMIMITLYAGQKKRHRSQNRLLDSVEEGEGGMIWENSIETCILSNVKQIASQGWMHETSAQGWCTGKTQRDGMGREVGGGIRMGDTCKSMADSCQVWQKPLQYWKVISLQLIKINGKKKRFHALTAEGSELTCGQELRFTRQKQETI